MNERKEIVAVIPARRGSKRLPHKNRLKIRGISLLERTVNAVRATRRVSRIILSTDDPNLIEEAEQIGHVEIHERPPHLAKDDVASEEVIANLIPSAGLEETVILLLQLTSPFRTERDIIGLLEEMQKRGALSAVSVTRWRPPPSPPFGTVVNSNELGNNQLEQLAEGTSPELKQDRHWALNGAIYAFHADRFLNTKKLYDRNAAILPMENWRSIDIDYTDDLEIAEALAAHKKI